MCTFPLGLLNTSESYYLHYLTCPKNNTLRTDIYSRPNEKLMNKRLTMTHLNSNIATNPLRIAIGRVAMFGRGVSALILIRRR